jgi:dihydroorotate dehydrogenase (NAD+) catalytic subunit
LAKIDLSLSIAGVKFQNPIMVASGTFGYGEEYSSLVDIDRIGAVVSKTLTLVPRPGHPPLRTFETPAGMLNAIGLANIGIDKFIREKLPFLRTKNTVCVANIAGQTIEEYARAAEKFNGVNGVHMLEINISSPNVKKGCMEFGASPELTYECIKAIKNAASLPVMAKLSPNVTDITAIALAAEEAGADCLSLINTIVGMAIDVKKKKPILSNITGGLSGPAIKPVGVAMTWKVYQKVKIPLVGMGGIMNLQDALEFIFAGASAVQLGTVNYVDPAAANKILTGLEKYLEENKICCFRELVGMAHKK